MSSDQFTIDAEATRTSEPVLPAEPPAGKPAWRRPTLTRIEIKRTLIGSAGLGDGKGPGTPA